MPYRFKKHYTREEARKLLPQVRKWLSKLNSLRTEVERYEERLNELTAGGLDTGGEAVNNWIRALAGMQEILATLQQRQIFLKDFKRGLVDFPSIREGREVFLCWEADEDDIEFWHDLESGYGGREKLD